MTEKAKAGAALTMSTLAFTVCFAAWMLNGVLATFLVNNGVFAWSKADLGWLIGIPVLTGSLMRLPVGILTDKYGGRIVYAILIAVSAVPMWLLSYADSYAGFALASLGFGLAGASFAVGIAYTSAWFSKARQGTALGVFGAGNAGSALTSIFAPMLLSSLTDGGKNLDGWRTLPRIYAVALLVTAAAFWLLTETRIPEAGRTATMRQRLAPLREVRVWRFGLYYFLVFGGFVALAGWLTPYYVSVYAMTLATAGLMTSIFSWPASVIRALGGWMSDRFGARRVMYWVLFTCVAGFALLCVPRMEIRSPGEGVLAFKTGTVKEVAADRVVVADKAGTESVYRLRTKPAGFRTLAEQDADVLVLPSGTSWQEPAIEVGAAVKPKQVLARGTTHIYFQANVWIFTAILFLVGIMMGIGKAAVYKHIPEYFPDAVPVVGSIVGVIGGLGGFVGPILFGYMLQGTGIWTTCWLFFLILSIVCLGWMHAVVRKMIAKRAPGIAEHYEDRGPAPDVGPDPVVLVLDDAATPGAQPSRTSVAPAPAVAAKGGA
jgi:NNP family nitrate/nitrite transporter-like MFS transporter